MSREQEVKAGLVSFAEILRAESVEVIKATRPWRDRTATYVVVGSGDRATDIVLTDEFLSDLPGTRDHQTEARSYASTIGGRIKCGPADLFCCRSGVPVRIDIDWPIQSGATTAGAFVSWLLFKVTNEEDSTVALASLKMSMFPYPMPSSFEIVKTLVNTARRAIDAQVITFHEKRPNGYQVLGVC